MSTAQELFDRNFTHNTTRTKRSAAYKNGVFATLQHRLEKKPMDVPYQPGTAEFDAYFAGSNEAVNIIAMEQMSA
jgi:hypothetical protein